MNPKGERVEQIKVKKSKGLHLMKLLVSCMHVKVYVNNIHMVRFPIDIPRGTFM